MGMLGNRCDGDAWQQVRWGCLATGAMGMLARGTAREFALHGKFAAPLLFCENEVLKQPSGLAQKSQRFPGQASPPHLPARIPSHLSRALLAKNYRARNHRPGWSKKSRKFPVKRLWVMVRPERGERCRCGT